MTALRLALVGCGFIGRRHLENVRALEGVELAATVDVREEAAAACAREFGARYHTTDTARVFGDPRVDAVIICTYHDTHAGLACEAAAAGKHILLEKPMALQVGECRRIARAAAAAGIVLALDFKFRFAPAVQKVREHVGRPVVMHSQLAMEPMLEGIWVRDPVRGGGLILATACHALDMACWLNASEPVRVYAESVPATPADGCNVTAVTATVRFASGSIASLLMAEAGENGYVGKWLHEVFDGRRTAVLYDHFRQVRFSGVEPDHYVAPDPTRADGTLGVLEDFVSSIREKRPPAIGARDGVRATLLATRILESLQTGRPEEVSLDDLD